MNRQVEYIIGITGSKGHGKDTVADMIKDILETDMEIKVAKLALADPMKEILSDLTGFPIELIEDLKRQEENGKVTISYSTGQTRTTVRKLLQILGQSVKRRLENDFVWAEALMDRIYSNEFLENGANCVIIPDIRFAFERNFINSSKPCNVFSVIRVENPNVPSNDSHESETNILSVPSDYTIVNDGSLDELKEKVREVVKEIFGA